MIIPAEKILIRTNYVPEKSKLWELFCTLGWDIGRSPETVKAAFDVSFVVSAWYGDILVGVGRALSDGLFYTAIYDVLVHPEFQRRGIGTRIMQTLLNQFAETSFLLMTTENTDKFYNKLGFTKAENAMKIVRKTATSEDEHKQPSNL